MTYDALAYVLSAFTLVNLWLAGNLNKWTWVVGIIGQFLRFFYIVGTQQWGLLVGAIGMIRNQLKWQKEGRV